MVLHQVKNCKVQGCFMQFLRLIFVKKLQLQAPTFQLTFPFLIPMPGCGRAWAMGAHQWLTDLPLSFWPCWMSAGMGSVLGQFAPVSVYYVSLRRQVWSAVSVSMRQYKTCLGRSSLRCSSHVAVTEKLGPSPSAWTSRNCLHCQLAGLI